VQIESRRDIGYLWLSAGCLFALSVAATRILGRSAEVRMTALMVGYVGLAAIGVALALTWRWLARGVPRLALRLPLRIALAAAMALLALALVFPFL